MTGDRDRQFESALKHQLRATGTPDRDACIDAETLAAWADEGLNAAQMASVELHVSQCARCQAIAGSAVGSTPLVAETVKAPAFRFPRWLIAPIAAAAAVTLWMIVPQETMQAPQPEAAAAVSEPPRPSVAARLNPDAPRAQAPAAARPRADRQEEATPPPAPSAPVAAADAVLQKSARFSARALEITTPNPSIRWRVVDQAIEHSDNGGASWVSVRPPGGEVITGGIAPTESICWLVGANGLVLVTADGQSFSRVPIPETVDLVSVSASDARSATVTTADGRRFTTTDAGRTWRPN